MFSRDFVQERRNGICNRFLDFAQRHRGETGKDLKVAELPSVKRILVGCCDVVVVPSVPEEVHKRMLHRYLS